MSGIHQSFHALSENPDPSQLYQYLMNENNSIGVSQNTVQASSGYGSSIQGQSWSTSSSTISNSPTKSVNHTSSTSHSPESYSRSKLGSRDEYGRDRSPNKLPGRSVTFTNTNGNSSSTVSSLRDVSPSKKDTSNYRSSSNSKSSHDSKRHRSDHHHHQSSSRSHSKRDSSPTHSKPKQTDNTKTSPSVSRTTGDNGSTLSTLMAEKQTRIILKVVEQVILNGVVVDEQVKETEMVTEGGKIPWTTPVVPSTASVVTLVASPSLATSMKEEPVQTTQTSLSVSSSNINKESKPEVCVNEETTVATPVSKGKDSSSKTSKSETSTGRPRGRPPSTNKGDKRNMKEYKSHSKSESSSKKVKRLAVEASSEESDDDHRRMRETASALLELQSDSSSSPAKKVKSNEKSSQPLGQNNNFTSLTFLPLKQGTTVLAKWTDKNFYAGKLVTDLGEGRWSILFDDGGKKTVHDSDIIAIPHLTIGQVVMATFSEGALCLRGVIKGGRYESGGKLFYDVEYTMDGSKMVTDRFSKRDIFLTSDLATTLLNTQSKGTQAGLDGKLTKFADVDLNNIIPKRSRTVAQTSTKKDGSSLTPATIDASTDDSETEASSHSSSSSHHAKAHGKAAMKTHSHGSPSKIKSSHMSISSTASTSPRMRRDSESNHSTTSSLGHEGASHVAIPVTQAQQPILQTIQLQTNESPQDQILGPILPEGSKLFEGIAFMLTTADASGTSNDDRDGQGRSSAPFDIPHLVKQIESGSGRVFQSLEDAHASPDSKEVVLLAYTYLRTVKYMQCLAAGIPCVMHSWVIESCKQNKLVKRDDYLLPSGYSITTNSLTTDRQVFKRSAQLFKNTRFMLISKNPRHAESWTSVLRAAHAIVVDDFPPNQGTATRKASNSVDLIISDSTCPSHIVKKAGQMGVPIVTSEYVVQCLINGRKLSNTAHEKFGINKASQQHHSPVPASPSGSLTMSLPPTPQPVVPSQQPNTPTNPC